MIMKILSLLEHIHTSAVTCVNGTDSISAYYAGLHHDLV